MKKTINTKRKGVHLIFDHHLEETKYAPNQTPDPAPKTHLFEEVLGFSGRLPESIVRRKTGRYVFPKAQRSYLARLLKGNPETYIAAGETLKDREEKEEYLKLVRVSELSQDRYHRTAELEDFKKFMVAEAELDKKRHELIRRSIREAIEAERIPVEVRYGLAHSLLSKELSREGIPSSREMPPTVFTHDVQVIRQLLLGKKPEEIDEELYKRALVGYRLGLNVNFNTQREWNRWNAFSRVVVERLSTQQLDEFIANPLTTNRVFEWNGLGSNPSSRQITSFLKKYSSYWKRKEIAR